MTREEALYVMNILRFGTFEEIINTQEIVNEALDVALEALKEQRPHGEWKYVTHYARRFRVCSVCKAEKKMIGQRVGTSASIAEAITEREKAKGDDGVI